MEKSNPFEVFLLPMPKMSLLGAEPANELSKHVDQSNSSTKTKGSEPAGRSTRKEGEKSPPKHEPITHHPWWRGHDWGFQDSHATGLYLLREPAEELPQPAQKCLRNEKNLFEFRIVEMNFAIIWLAPYHHISHLLNPKYFRLLLHFRFANITMGFWGFGVLGFWATGAWETNWGISECSR